MESVVHMVKDPIDLKKLSCSNEDPACGAEVLFVGKVRNYNEGKEVLEIEYTAYSEMAIQEMKKIVSEANHQWPFRKCTFVHRLGRLPVGEISVALLISSVHRKEAYQASQWIISEMKRRVPIWKKELCHHEV